MRKGLLGRIFGISLVSLTAVATAVATFAWFTKPGGITDNHIDGEVSLRSYYYDGDGTKQHPYEIVSPIHFYNLTRLQNLGLYTTDTWFQIGHDFEDVGLACINTYVGGNPIKEKFLDMGDLSSTNTILPIGSESAPFVGHFNGNSLPVKNLKVQGNPEDIGVFGYVSYEGVVTGLVCENLEICSLGYSSDISDNSHQLFTEDIDHLFDENASGFNTASLALVDRDAGETGLKHLNGAQGTSITNLNLPSNLADGGNSSISTKYHFIARYPTGLNKGPFSYSWKSSSGLIKLREKHEDYDVLDIDLAVLRDSTGFNSGGANQIDARISIIASVDVDGFVFSRVIQSYTCEFYSNGHGYYGWLTVNNNKIITSALTPSSLIDDNIGSEGDYSIFENNGVVDLWYRGATSWSQIAESSTVSFHYGTTAPTWTEYNSYNKVGGSYYVQLIEPEEGDEGPLEYVLYTRDYENDYFSSNIFCDYEVKPEHESTDKNTNYHHGNNVGLLAGHVDGSIDKSYVYNGKFTLNHGSGFDAINTESETGLVGEIGTNVVNSLDPEFGLIKNGETGIMNFSRIYNLIRDKNVDGTDHIMAANDPVMAGLVNGVHFISYDNYRSVNTVGPFAKYLRKNPDISRNYDTPGFITSVNEPGTDSTDPDYVATDPGVEPSNIPLHNFRLTRIKDIYNSVEFSANQLVEDEKTGYYVDTLSFDLYIKNDYKWSDPIEMSGDNLGSLSPGVGDYNSGDYFFNEVTDTLFVKDGSTWTKLASLYGDLLSDETPHSALGTNGDLYVDIANERLFQKENGFWNQMSVTVHIDSIAPADDGEIPNGTYFVDTESYAIFMKDEGSWGRLSDSTFGSGPVDKSLDNSGDRGLGVFKIVSKYSSEAKIYGDSNPGKYFTTGMGECRILKGSPHSKVYFSTAELDYSRHGDDANFDNLFRATTLPTYCDTESFNGPFSRDYNYCFELDLSDSSRGHGQFMHNTKSNFLTHYLYSILIDKSGAHIQPNSDKFGFLFSVSNDKKVKNLDSLSSYMPVGDPAPGGANTKNNFGTTSNPRYYPENSIVFHIENTHGANVSIVGNGADITIYRNDPNKSDNITPAYTMKSTPYNERDSHRFFSYDYVTGDTSEKAINYGDYYIKTAASHQSYELYKENESDSDWTPVTDPSIGESFAVGTGVPVNTNDGNNTYFIDAKANNLYKWNGSAWEKKYGVLSGSDEPPTDPDMKESDALYGHIFKLPKGDYVVGGKDGKTAKIYYLAVQGQSDADLGDNDRAGIGNAVTDVDFLTSQPDYVHRLNWTYANFSFKCTFNSVSGEFIVGVDNRGYFRIFFSDYPDTFVTYLLLYSQSSTLQYYVILQTTASGPYVESQYSNQSVTYRAG